MAKDPYSNVFLKNGRMQHNYVGGDVGNADPISALLASNQYRDIPQNIIASYMSGSLTQEEALAQIYNTPLYDAQLGPLTDTGSGFKTASGQSVAINPQTHQYEVSQSPTSSAPPGTATPAGITPLDITSNLGPGSSGDDVKKLQSWLKAQGYFPQGQDSTGYYGDITKNAVAAWQKANNIETQGNSGYFGPISRNFITTSSTTVNASGQPTPIQSNTPQGGGTPQGTGTPALPQTTTDALHFLGWTDDQIKNASPSDAQNWAMIGEYLQKQTTLQGQVGEINAQKLNDAYTAATKDPTIAGKYSDIQSVDQYNFQQQLTSMQSSTDVASAQQKIQMENDKKALAEQAAQAGQAYSGFREQAKGQLATTQQGIITSSRQQLQENLNNLATQYKQKYGTSGNYGISSFSSLFPNTSLNYSNPLSGSTENIAAATPGDLQGNLGLQKEQDILAKTQDIYGGLKTP